MLVSVSAAWLCSCGSDSSSSYSMSASGDCAITAVTMGTMTRTVFTTTAAGADTSYNVAVAGAAYPMFVDQIKMDIYNPDSLPVNTNVRKVVLSSISADGIIAYRTPYGNDSLFSTRDTLDFTDPVFFTCFSSDGTQSKTYRMTVNVHKSNSEDFSWTTEADGVSLMEGVSSQKAFVSDGRLMVFALSGGQPVLLKAGTDNAGEWESSPISGLEDMQPAGVQGNRAGSPVTILPTLTGWKPSTSFEGSMRLRISASNCAIWAGRGSCTRMPSIFSSAFRASILAINSSLLVSSGIAITSE